MPRYPLDDLLRVRRFREDHAATELQNRRKAVEAAEQALAQRRRAVADYHAWRLRREDELYHDVLQKAVTRQDLDDLKLTIEALRTEELNLHEQVVEAERQLSAARAAAQSAHAAWTRAVRNREKIDEHKEHWSEAIAREIEYSQDLELEDFRVRTPDDDEPEEAETSDA